tara:strand:- start:53 stop:454 length:402 start_codon:yes stop_codon:yes gene_type:complete
MGAAAPSLRERLPPGRRPAICAWDLHAAIEDFSKSLKSFSGGDISTLETKLLHFLDNCDDLDVGEDISIKKLEKEIERLSDSLANWDKAPTIDKPGILKTAQAMAKDLDTAAELVAMSKGHDLHCTKKPKEAK